MFILNNEKKLCELFPLHIDLIKARADCAKNKSDDGYYKSYAHEKVRIHFERIAQLAFNKYRSTAANLLSSEQTVFGGRAESTSELPVQHQGPADKKPNGI